MWLQNLGVSVRTPGTLPCRLRTAACYMQAPFPFLPCIPLICPRGPLGLLGLGVLGRNPVLPCGFTLGHLLICRPPRPEILDRLQGEALSHARTQGHMTPNPSYKYTRTCRSLPISAPFPLTVLKGCLVVAHRPGCQLLCSGLKLSPDPRVGVILVSKNAGICQACRPL